MFHRETRPVKQNVCPLLSYGQNWEKVATTISGKGEGYLETVWKKSRKCSKVLSGTWKTKYNDPPLPTPEQKFKKRTML